MPPLSPQIDRFAGAPFVFGNRVRSILQPRDCLGIGSGLSRDCLGIGSVHSRGNFDWNWAGIGSGLSRDFLGNGSVKSGKDFWWKIAKNRMFFAIFVVLFAYMQKMLYLCKLFLKV